MRVATEICHWTVGLCPTSKYWSLACVNMTVERHVLLHESYVKYGSSNPGENYIVNFPVSQFHK